MVKKAVPMRTSPEFLRALKKLKMKCNANGKETSLRDLTEKIAEPEIFNEIEKNILDEVKMVEKSIMRFDKR